MGSLPHMAEETPFTLDNIPFGVISTSNDASPRCATAIGDHAIDLHVLIKHGIFQDQSVAEALSQPNLNTFAALPAQSRTAAREAIIAASQDGNIPASCLHKLADVKNHLPVAIGDYTDYTTSLEHVKNCSAMTKQPMSPNFYHMPAAYNGRASSVIPSPSVVRRPRGIYWKTGANGEREAEYGVSKCMDFELEMAFIVSKPVPYGETMKINESPEHVFGFVVLNDWSSRDIQVFEMPPLGPFNGKSFGTTISPWVVTLDALQAFACPPLHKTSPMPHLTFEDLDHATFDIKLAVHIERAGKRHTVCTSNLNYLYWTPFQQITHHASANCGLRTGDLIGTGTISGDGVDDTGRKFELGCFFEATKHGHELVQLKDGMKFSYLEDNDSVVLEAWCEDKNGKKVLGFGECKGQLVGPDAPIS
jgi:fumarylacetoacetase